MASTRQICDAVKAITENPCELGKIDGIYHWIDQQARTRFYETATPWSRVNDASVDEWVADYITKLDMTYGIYDGWTDEMLVGTYDLRKVLPTALEAQNVSPK